MFILYSSVIKFVLGQ